MILALDTATRQVSIALHDGEAVLAESTWRTGDHHTVEFPPAVHDLMTRVDVSVPDLAAIAVALGPGSYTGLRIGMSFAKGLALSASSSLPLIGVPTLDITAAAQSHHANYLCAVAQAGRGRINAAFYRWQAGWQPQESPILLTWSDLIARLDGQVQVGGEIDPAGRAELASLGDRVIIAGGAESLRRAGYLAEIAARRLAQGDVDDPAALAPDYLHSA